MIYINEEIVSNDQEIADAFAMMFAKNSSDTIYNPEFQTIK